MKRVEQWPPPEWTEVIIKWSEILDDPGYPIRDILEWLECSPGSPYHLHGWKSTEGFAFRFSNPRDATIFAIRWL
jgi:hypothetical protein